ncbi:MAG: glucose-6-phosphate dehydrogenase assembly protein OpcA [Frankiaceae bacterium]|nr:glucose-6-phosphate dehydrogenase assembly protein OpcA [Frankiaceae bacterium]MBV9368237.1 glucose-6-phosphate dehydrogenase assembly protein OpcA [Frankiales bacterium]
MATTLWDTTGTDIVNALLAERRTAGALASGLALSLVVVVDEKQVQEAETAATIAAAAHPCRLLIVVRRSVDADNRLDAEVQVGGRLGPTEAVVMRMYGRLGLHAESVVLPLLAPDAPVVTWWHGAPPDEIATDGLGVLANRRITDCARAADPLAALRRRAEDYAPGDTDLAWTRTTPWRALLASALDAVDAKPAGAMVGAEAGNPSASLLCGWLNSRLGVHAEVDATAGPGITSAAIDAVCADESPYTVSISRPDGRLATLRRGDEDERQLPLPRRELGDLLAEELRRMDPDAVYAEALAAATGVSGIADRSPVRTHVWRDPAWSGAGASS